VQDAVQDVEVVLLFLWAMRFPRVLDTVMGCQRIELECRIALAANRIAVVTPADH
jgi:hypothetical protein